MQYVRVIIPVKNQIVLGDLVQWIFTGHKTHYRVLCSFIALLSKLFRFSTTWTNSLFPLPLSPFLICGQTFLDNQFRISFKEDDPIHSPSPTHHLRAADCPK